MFMEQQGDEFWVCAQKAMLTSFLNIFRQKVFALRKVLCVHAKVTSVVSDSLQPYGL